MERQTVLVLATSTLHAIHATGIIPVTGMSAGLMLPGFKRLTDACLES